MAVRMKIGSILAAAVTIGAPAPGLAAPTTHPRVGQCVVTTVKAHASRLEGDPASGSSIAYANGRYQVSYDTVPGIETSRHGDPVRLCVAELPKGCPKGDYRGIIYHATNLRTGAKWEASDSEHDCGGL